MATLNVTTLNIASLTIGGTLPAGSTVISFASVPTLIGPTNGMLIIDPYTIEAELRLVVSTTGTTIAVAATTYDHANGDNCIFIPFGLVPWTFWGAKGTGSTGDATNNVTGFNRLTNQIYAIGVTHGPTGIFMPNGLYYVDGELRLERDQKLVGGDVDACSIKAHTTFPFDGTGEIAIIHTYRDGVATIYATPGASGRWPMSDFNVQGGDIANSNGILSSPQQPDHWENMRIDHCAGLYGVCLADVQQFQMTNMEFIANNIALRYRSASFVWCRTLNIEQSTTGDFIAEIQGGGGGSCNENTFDGVHLESPLTAGQKYFNIGAGVMWNFKNVLVSNQATSSILFYMNQGAESISDYPVFTLENILANQNDATFLMVNDVGRGLTINSQEDSRIIPFLCSGTSQNYWSMRVMANGQIKSLYSRSGLVAAPTIAPTIASSGTIAPVAPITLISGTSTISTITAPAPISVTGGQITLIPTGLWATNTAGNIALATTAVVSKALNLTFDQSTSKWYPSY
jgi:hypothetical protein